MPRLTKNSLEKRFTCPYCPKSLRTRQGLSGHIQFGHGVNRNPQQFDLTYITAKIAKCQILRETTEISRAKVDACIAILCDWLEIKNICNFLKIELTAQDFKNYLMTGLAVKR